MNNVGNPFMPTQEEIEIGKLEMRNLKVFSNKTSNCGNEVTVSCNGIKINISDNREKPLSQDELKERCKDILLLMLINAN